MCLQPATPGRTNNNQNVFVFCIATPFDQRIYCLLHCGRHSEFATQCFPRFQSLWHTYTPKHARFYTACYTRLQLRYFRSPRVCIASHYVRTMRSLPGLWFYFDFIYLRPSPLTALFAIGAVVTRARWSCIACCPDSFVLFYIIYLLAPPASNINVCTAGLLKFNAITYANRIIHALTDYYSK